MDKHTPGPWRVHAKAALNVETERGRSIASCGGYGDNKNIEKTAIENEANARLIAAAPDLLAAARRALNFIENTESEMSETLESGDLLRAAIAKAEGRE